MTENKVKPREFWIEEWNGGNWRSSTVWSYKLTGSTNSEIDLIHVIEYSAYELLKAKLDKVESDYKKAVKLLSKFQPCDFMYEDGSEDLENEVLAFFDQKKCEDCDGVYEIKELNSQHVCGECEEIRYLNQEN